MSEVSISWLGEPMVDCLCSLIPPRGCLGHSGVLSKLELKDLIEELSSDILVGNCMCSEISGRCTGVSLAIVGTSWWESWGRRAAVERLPVDVPTRRLSRWAILAFLGNGSVNSSVTAIFSWCQGDTNWSKLASHELCLQAQAKARGERGVVLFSSNW